ncbi:hypothetical protein BT63DRAFT_423667 [Microthyrium microscopicum]|uniref:Uncharacterized protein n=1 Tax=Microthyrium microscopicum TaxID=703497 RepID=A0A6A6UKP7_9PEZI|nr:hypothetical protein BT63DRAFT_423667 [Microthyrium microscopicum]
MKTININSKSHESDCISGYIPHTLVSVSRIPFSKYLNDCSSSLSLSLTIFSDILPTLWTTSPNLQAFTVCSSMTIANTLSTRLPIVLPAIEPSTNPPTVFSSLGLLQPIAGCQAPLDAIVVIDPASKLRLSLPIGWGIGSTFNDPTHYSALRRIYRRELTRAVETIDEERRGAEVDFYEIAKTYF